MNDLKSKLMRSEPLWGAIGVGLFLLIVWFLAASAVALDCLFGE